MKTLTIQGYLNNYGFCIKKKSISDKQIIKIISNYFKVTPKDEDDSKSFNVFYEDLKFLVLPKFTPNIIIKLLDIIQINNISYNNINFSIYKYKYKKEIANFNFSGTLRDYQQNIIETILNIFKINISSPKGGLIKLSCGGGKTIIAIYLSYILKLKTLIIVHQDFLLDQWIDRFNSFTNAKVGTIKQNIIDIHNNATNYSHHR